MADRLVSVNDDFDFPAPVAARQAARLGDATTAEGKAVADSIKPIRGDVPAWSTNKSTWDASRGLYNWKPGNRRRWDQALAKGQAGVKQAHIATHLDSISHGVGATFPWAQKGYAGRLRTMLDAKYGVAGSGVIIPWAGSDWTQYDPRLTKTAGAGNTPAGFEKGIYKKGALRIDQSAPNAGLNGARLKITDLYCDRLFIHTAATTTAYSVVVDRGTPQEQALAHTAMNEEYKVGNQSIRSAAIPLGTHTVEIYGATLIDVLGVEGRVSSGAVRVSNLAYPGMAMADAVMTDDVTGNFGMAVAFDMVGADLNIIMPGTNDWQGHVPVATYKARLINYITRAQWNPRQDRAGGDVLLVAPAQPLYSMYPLDKVQTPALPEYLRATYEVADQLNVPLLDLAYAWKDYASSTVFFHDGLHPSDSGHFDIARRIVNAIS